MAWKPPNAQRGRPRGDGALTDAQRARAYRRRKKEQALRLINGTPEEWVAEYPGQRPPFGPGNRLSFKHGATMPEVVDPLAMQLIDQVLEVPGNEYLREPRNAIAVDNWAHARARVLLMRRYLATQDIETALSEVTEIVETEERPSPGELRRQSRMRSTVSTWKAMESAERQESHLAVQLGLTPLARVKLGKAAQSPSADLALIWAREDEQDTA